MDSRMPKPVTPCFVTLPLVEDIGAGFTPRAATRSRLNLFHPPWTTVSLQKSLKHQSEIRRGVGSPGSETGFMPGTITSTEHDTPHGPIPPSLAATSSFPDPGEEPIRPRRAVRRASDSPEDRSSDERASESHGSPYGSGTISEMRLLIMPQKIWQHDLTPGPTTSERSQGMQLLEDALASRMTHPGQNPIIVQPASSSTEA